MLKFLKNLFRKPSPEGKCSRFGAAKATPLTPADIADMRRLEAARDAAWRRAWLAAQQSSLESVEWRG